MPTIVWILMWVVIFGVVALLAVREVRSARRRPVEFDRLRHQATAEADMRSTVQGPNGASQGFWG
jgi:hypothetical protein